jgi:hypothetical protein
MFIDTFTSCLTTCFGPTLGEELFLEICTECLFVITWWWPVGPKHVVRQEVNVSINIIVAIAGICLIDLCYIFKTRSLCTSKALARVHSIRRLPVSSGRRRHWDTSHYMGASTSHNPWGLYVLLRRYLLFFSFAFYLLCVMSRLLFVLPFVLFCLSVIRYFVCLVLCSNTATGWTPIGSSNNNYCYYLRDRLCGLVVRVLGYNSGGPGSIPGTTRKKVVGLERGPLSLVSTTEELLDRKVAAPV